MKSQFKTLLFAFLFGVIDCTGQQPPAATASKQTATQKATVVNSDKVSAGKSTVVVPAENTDATKASVDSESSHAAYQQVYRDAVTSYKQQSIEAHQSGDHKREVAVALSSARAAEALAATDASQIPAAEAAYRSAIAAAKESEQGEERSQAASNLAVLLMKSGKNQEALEVVKEIGFSPSLSPQQRAVFSYNMARTYELNGDRQQAFERYADAYASNPDFTQAALNGFRLLSTENEAPVEDAVKLSDRGIASGYASMVHEQLLALMHKWATANDAQRLLAALVRCYVAESLSPVNFKEKEAKRLSEAVAESPRLRDAAGQVNAAYFAKLSPVPFQAAGQFSMWRGQQWESTTFAPLLGVAARWFTENGQPEQALARQMVAWNLTRDPQYAMEFASLIRLQPKLDVDGRLLNGLLDSMFMAKGNSYARQDWGSIFQMHVAIGTILERNGRWGASGEVRGATFQWEHAIVAYDRLHAKNPSALPVPGLHAHLAACYARTNRSQQAAREFLLAAEGFVATGDIEEARHNVELAKSSATTLSPEDLKHLQNVEDAVAGQKQ